MSVATAQSQASVDTLVRQDEVERRFMTGADRPPPSETELEIYKDLQILYTKLGKTMNGEIEGSRELSLALTSLEESFMWMGKALFQESKKQ